MATNFKKLNNAYYGTEGTRFIVGTANARQVGGDHYDKTGEQHWDRQYRLYGAGYFIGCATKYIERYKDKNGKQDLMKAVHFIEKLIELEYPEPVNGIVGGNFDEDYEDPLNNTYVNKD